MINLLIGKQWKSARKKNMISKVIVIISPMLKKKMKMSTLVLQKLIPGEHYHFLN
jgi:hypothetical protein